jgi:hypothetical protein
VVVVFGAVVGHQAEMARGELFPSHVGEFVVAKPPRKSCNRYKVSCVSNVSLFQAASLSLKALTFGVMLLNNTVVGGEGSECALLIGGV